MSNAQLAPIDLLVTTDRLVELLRQAIRDREWLDAYLLTAGLNQMVEDRLHPIRFSCPRQRISFKHVVPGQHA